MMTCAIVMGGYCLLRPSGPSIHRIAGNPEPVRPERRPLAGDADTAVVSASAHCPVGADRGAAVFADHPSAGHDKSVNAPEQRRCLRSISTSAVEISGASRALATVFSRDVV